MSDNIERISLLDSLDRGWLKLPYDAMRELGSATQTLAGILRITNKKTFVRQNKIAKSARLPLRTVTRHLHVLHGNGWTINEGRQAINEWKSRRTVTIRLTEKTKEHLNPYGFLPWWACCPIANHGGSRLSWSARAVLSVVMAQLCKLKHVVHELNIDCFNPEIDGPIDNQSVRDIIEGELGDNRFRFSLSRLEHETGLSRPAVIKAKKALMKFGIIDWMGSTCIKTDTLAPNWDFNVVVTPIGPEKGFISFCSEL